MQIWQVTLRKKLCLLLAVAWAAVSLSGCAAIRYLVTGDWNGDADLVVVSQTPAVIGSIALYGEEESRVVADGRGMALLERGESYGLKLNEGEENGTIALLDMNRQEVGRAGIQFDGTRLYLTLWEDGSVTVSKEEP